MGKSCAPFLRALLVAGLSACGKGASIPKPAAERDGTSARPPAADRGPSPDFESSARQQGYDPRAHRVVLEYFRRLWTGEARDAAFEAKVLSRDLGFRVLNLAELVLAMSKEIDLPIDRAIEFLSIGNDPEPLSEGVLAARIAELSATCSEEERARRVLGDLDLKEIALSPLKKPIDGVEPLIRYCYAIEQWCREDGGHRFPSMKPRRK